MQLVSVARRHISVNFQVLATLHGHGHGGFVVVSLAVIIGRGLAPNYSDNLPRLNASDCATLRGGLVA